MAPAAISAVDGDSLGATIVYEVHGGDRGCIALMCALCTLDHSDLFSIDAHGALMAKSASPPSSLLIVRVPH